MTSLVVLGALVVVAGSVGFILVVLLRTLREIWVDNRKLQKDLMNAFVAKDWQQYAALKLDLNPEESQIVTPSSVNHPVAYGETEEELVQAALAQVGADLEGPFGV